MNARSVILLGLVLLTASVAAAQVDVKACTGGLVHADLVALDQPFMLNRLGAAEPNGMIFALRRDVVATNGASSPLKPGQVRLRSDKRPRPVVLRMNQGQCIYIRLWNLLSNPPQGTNNATLQPATRYASVHVSGLNLMKSIDDDGTWVGENGNATLLPDENATKTYIYYAQEEGVFHLFSGGAKIGNANGQLTEGMFGALVVEPSGAQYYRSQLTNDDFIKYVVRRDANKNIMLTPEGQPVIDYDAMYPADHPKYPCKPVLRMVAGRWDLNAGKCSPTGRVEVFYDDLYAMITGPSAGRFPDTNRSPSFDPIPSSPDRRQPFREFVIAYHEITDATQAFPEFYPPSDANVIGMNSTLNSGKDNFGINLGTGGIGAEILANRIGVGPMWDCVDCKFEEFFLTSWAVGDPGMVVDIPANANTLTPNQPNVASPLSVSLQTCQATAKCSPLDPPTIKGAKATKAFYPDDPSNVMHSYLNDHVKFRLLHAAGTLTHVHHQHAHQWLHTPNDADSTYLDSQLISPGATFTLEISHGGSGNRNKTPGDSIFHCHFYPHFAQGMWAMWRVHDMFEMGTQLDANGIPVPGSRALPDGEIASGTPIPSIVPLPTIGMPLMPGYAWVSNRQVSIGGTCQNGAINNIAVDGGCTNGQQYDGIVGAD
ncbi:MAG TPA: hypothetical protein VN181_15645, partial [Thermoanaerobaculia bacterium]|nr:hypothetical protein [Thermoanaerobaculia bacterium]